jgi:hypothetical protein
MRKTICWALTGATIGIAGFCLAAKYVGCQPGFLNRLGNIVATQLVKPAAEMEASQQECSVCAPDEPCPVDALLPDPAKLTADWPFSEPIDLLKSQETASELKQDDGSKQPQHGLVPDNLIPEEVVPAAAIRAADEAACFRLMPYSETTELLPMPRADEIAEAEEEEAIEPTIDPKIVEERLNRILQSYLRNGKYPGQADVDTLEFRPSDAQKGEFDRIPF